MLQPSLELETILARITALKARFDALRTTDNESVREALYIEYTYQSNRIEGNSLTLRETQMVVSEGITIAGKPMREHLEAINHSEAIHFIEDVARRAVPLNAYTLNQIHALVLYGIDRTNAGKYRTVPVMIAGSSHIPPQPYMLGKLMEDYFLFYETNTATLHPVVLAAEMHERLVTIHPFVDGNGRTARLVMNLILLQHGYPLAIITGDYQSRMQYYTALEQTHTDEYKTAFHALIARTVEAALERNISILGGA